MLPLKQQEFFKTIAQLSSSNIGSIFEKKNQTSVGPTKILNFLFLGSLEDALNGKAMKKLNIKRVLNISEKNLNSEFLSNDAEHLLQIPIRDSNTAQLFPYFEQCFEFIELAKKSGENILLHCLAGISRSPTLAIAYLMRSKKLSCDKAREFIKRLRPSISPNINFMGQLTAYESFLNNQRILSNNRLTLTTFDKINNNLNNEMFSSSLMFKNKKSSESNNLESKNLIKECPSSLKTDNVKDVLQRRRPNNFKGVNIRNLNNLPRSNTFYTTEPSFSYLLSSPCLTSSNQSAATSNETRKLSLKNSFFESLQQTSSVLHSSLQSTREILTPSTEFLKLDLSITNQCFDVENSCLKLNFCKNNDLNSKSYLKNLKKNLSNIDVVNSDLRVSALIKNSSLPVKDEMTFNTIFKLSNNVVRRNKKRLALLSLKQINTTNKSNVGLKNSLRNLFSTHPKKKLFMKVLKK